MDRIAAVKLALADRAAAFEAIRVEIAQELAEITARAADGAPLVPEFTWGDPPDGVAALVRRCGCVVVRGVFPRSQAAAWDAEITEYLARNGAATKARARRPGRWGDGPPQIFSVYWSHPQVAARQSPQLAAVRAWLNRLWRWEGWFDPDRDCTYADRIRRRTPGDTSLGLGPHIDGGTAGRWLDPAGRHPYRAVFAGDLAGFDPFDAAGRTAAAGAEERNACSVFRSWQGWTALTEQGPGDGTLRVLPVTRAIASVLLRPFAADVPADSLCGAETATAFWVTADWHAPLLRAMVPIPRVAPGDTVWWHPDLIHAVEAVHGGRAPSNVMYIGAAPDCARNRGYLGRQWAAFAAGRSPPDFPADDLETDFAGRAGADALTALGRRQMGHGQMEG
jgi:hypothetical protein